MRIRFRQRGSSKLAVHNLVIGFAERIENSTFAVYADCFARGRFNGRVAGLKRMALRLEGAASHRDRSKRGIDAHGIGHDLSAGNGNGCGTIIRIDGGGRAICRFLSNLAALHGKGAGVTIDINSIPAVHGILDLAGRHSQIGRRIDLHCRATLCSVDHGTARKGGCAGRVQEERITVGSGVFQCSTLQFKAATDINQIRRTRILIGNLAITLTILNDQATRGLNKKRLSIGCRNGVAIQVQC